MGHCITAGFILTVNYYQNMRNLQWSKHCTPLVSGWLLSWVKGISVDF